jgi:hypothetical protein
MPTHSCRRILLTICLLTFAAPALAQQPTHVTLTEDVPIFVRPDPNRQPLRMGRQGSNVRVLLEEGDWYQIEFEDPQWGRRVGYIEKRFTKPAPPDYSRMPAIDVSVPRDPPPPAPTIPPPPTQALSATRPMRGWFDVSFGLALPQNNEFSNFVEIPFRRETFRVDANYELGLGAAIDLNGGVMFNRHVGIGFGITGQGHVRPADVAISVPDLLDFNNSATDESSTDDLTRSEGGIHISGVYTVQPNRAFTVRVFGGPTFFRATQELVTDVSYRETILPTNTVTITNTEIEEFDGTGWGFHAGADFAAYFTRVFGLGGVVRYSKGTVTMPIGLSVNLDDPQDFDYPVGGLHLAGGIRLRF